MPKRSEYRQGTPNWVDLQTTDQSAAKKFYTSLFGWGYDDNPVPGGGGVYSMATLNGEAVAAIAPMPPGAPEGMPPIWNTYIAVDDVDAVVDKVVPGGGQVMMPAFDIGDAGRMSFITDPTGAAVGLWQANRHIGATLVNETGTLIWNELLTDKPDLALAFYEAVVGLTHSSMEIAAGQNFHRGGGEQLGLRNGLHDNGFSRLRRFIDPVDIGAAEPYRGGTGRGHQKAHAFVFFARLDVVGVLHADDLARNAGAGHFQPNPIGGVLVDVFDLAHVQCLGRE